jgi:O-methyltransferase domain
VPVLLSDLNMLLLSGGQERTNNEYGKLLTDAGFSLAGSSRLQRRTA